MGESKSGRKPDKAGGVGTEVAGNAEVEGHERKLIYTCFNCGSGNYVDPSWKYFTCWKCKPNGLNHIH